MIAVSVTAVSSSRVGASLTAVTDKATTSDSVENAVLPPVTLAVPPLLPVLPSQAHRVTDSAIGTFQLPSGLNYRRASLASNKAADALGAVEIAVQLPPASMKYQLPCAVSSAVIAIPLGLVASSSVM